MTQLTYYPSRDEAPAEAAWRPEPDDVHTLRHGYNLADLNRLARMSTTRVSGGALDNRSRYEVAWSAIAEALYASPVGESPTPSDLIAVGQTAISQHARDEMHHRGADRHTPGEGMKRFAVYWETFQHRSPSPEGRVVERAALWQIWPKLTDREREVLLALAAHEDYRAAADALGAKYGTFVVNLSHARRRFLQLWHEGETPSRVWGTDRRVGAYAAVREPVRKRRAATRAVARREGRPVHELVHGKASTYTNHRCRCAPCTQAASDKARENRRKAGIAPRQFRGRT